MPRSVTIPSGKTNVQLPNGFSYDAGDTVVLTDAEWATISTTAESGGWITDNGAVDATDEVSAQGAHQAAPTALTSAAPVALTSSQNATTNGSDPTTTQTLANALKVSYNALQVDVAALRTAQGLLQADVATLRTEVASLITALTGTGKPLASS